MISYELKLRLQSHRAPWDMGSKNALKKSYQSELQRTEVPKQSGSQRPSSNIIVSVTTIATSSAFSDGGIGTLQAAIVVVRG